MIMILYKRDEKHPPNINCGSTIANVKNLSKPTKTRLHNQRYLMSTDD